MIGSFLSVAEMTSPITSRFGKNTVETRYAFLDDLLQLAGDDLGIRLDDHFTGLGVDDVVESKSSLRNRRRQPRPYPCPCGEDRLIADFVTFLAFTRNVFFLVLDVLFGTHSDEMRFALVFDLDEKLALFDD